MLYYKIIQNSQIIGVSTSDSCFNFELKHSMLQRTTLELAEYMECSSSLYHAFWMQPIKTNIYTYQDADILEIDKTEYDILVPATENAPVHIDEEEIVIPPDVDPTDEITLEYVRAAKINEMSKACNRAIEEGFDVEIDGNVEHFSLTTQDQLNLMDLSSMIIQGEDEIPYHADGQPFKFYTADEIDAIISEANTWKMYNTTYFNSLKTYINALDNIQDIAALTYGAAIPVAYQSEVYKAMLNN